MAIWCVQFQTRRGSGLLRDLCSGVAIHRCLIGLGPCVLCNGKGHDSPGHAVHVRARTPAGALARALGIAPSTARRWIERGWAYVWDGSYIP